MGMGFQNEEAIRAARPLKQNRKIKKEKLKTKLDINKKTNKTNKVEKK